MGTKFWRILLALYQFMMMVMAAIAIVIGGFGTLMSSDWSYLLWSLPALPMGLALAFGLPVLWAWCYQYSKTLIHKTYVYQGGRRDIVSLVHTAEADSRSQV